MSDSGTLKASTPKPEDTIRYLDGRYGFVDVMDCVHFDGNTVVGYTVRDGRTEQYVRVERAEPKWSGVVLWREVA